MINNQDLTPKPDYLGTMHMGLIVGGDAGETSIGVAPGAKWIAVNIFDHLDQARASGIHAGFQWLLDPDGNPDTDDAPDIIYNNWGLQYGYGCLEQIAGISFRDDIRVLRQAGIAVVFGASGDGFPDTSSSPANYPESFAVGGVMGNERYEVSAYSGRGPSACDGGIYPDIVAPDGWNPLIWTAFSDHWWYSASITLDAPHVAGAMALLLSAYPDLTPHQLETALKASAIDLGAPGPDNESGYGFIDVMGAYQAVSQFDSVEITNLIYDPSAKILTVVATSTDQPNVSLTAEGLGPLNWKSSLNVYRNTFFIETDPPASVTVNSSGGGSDTYTAPAAETVAITNVVYSARKSRLLVEATSSLQSDVSLSAAGYGNLLWDSGRGLYRRVFGNVAESPTSVTVKSSGGGSDHWNLEGTTAIVSSSTMISTTTSSTTTSTVFGG